MKIFVKTLKGSHFEIQVQPQDKVADVKKNIETVQGSNVYPSSQQILIHQGKVLKDGTTLEENKVAENSFLVIMLSKNKSASGEGSTASTPSTAPPTKAPMTSPPPPISTPAPALAPAPATTQTPVSMPARAPVSAPAPSAAPTSVTTAAASESDAYSRAASNLVPGSNLEESIQQILDIGGGTWDRETIVRALRVAYNNPERAVDYLYSGIPEFAEVPPVDSVNPTGQTVNEPAQATQQSASPIRSDANPLDLFPQGFPNMSSRAASGGTLDFLRNSPQFQALRAMVQTNPQILQPMLQELGKQNPHLMRLIQEHQADFLRLINEPAEGTEGNILGQLAAAMPQEISVTPEERDAIERLVAMGFDRSIVLEVFFACNKSEELAANYLIDHINEFED